MSRPRRLATLFEEEPYRWGLRGDVHLWRDMGQIFGDEPFPETEGELATLIETTFGELTGASLSTEEPFFVEKYAHGGMSSGYVSPEWWRETGLPLLRARYTETLIG